MKFPFDLFYAFPLQDSPGGFGFQRKMHQHEGVDLYCPDGTEVHALEAGTVVYRNWFTGEKAGSPWWNNTECLMIESKDFVLNYGEIKPCDFILGHKVKQGEKIGTVVEVLKKRTANPASMLHIEMYKAGTTSPITEWTLGSPKPDSLLDPTDYLRERLC